MENQRLLTNEIPEDSSLASQPTRTPISLNSEPEKPRNKKITLLSIVFIIALAGVVVAIINFTNDNKNGSALNSSLQNKTKASGLIFFTYNQNKGYPGADKPPKSGVAVMNSDGSNPRLIYSAPSTEDTPGFTQGLAVSTEASKIVFGEFACLYTMSLKGGSAHLLFGKCKGGEADFYPTLTKDGKTLYFYSENRSKGTGIYKYKIDSTDEPTLIWKGSVSTMSISPDSSKLAFFQFGGDKKSKISILSLDDSKVSELSLNVFEIHMISWSPDMKTILANVSIPQKLPVNQLIDAETGNLVKTITTPEEGPGSYSTSWSPDGTSFVFMSGEQPPKGASEDAGQYFSLYTTASSGNGKAVRITHAFDCSDPVWTVFTQLPQGARIQT